MPLGTNHITNTTAAKFIPAIWVDQVRKFMEAKLVAAKLCKTITHKGKPGDTIHIPDLSALSVNNKLSNTQVTLQSPTESEFLMSINKHKEVSFLIEDIAKVQASYDLIKEYTSSAAYAISKQIDTDILALATSLSKVVIGGDGSTAWSPAANANTGNGTDLTDAGIRKAIEYLDLNNVPEEDRVLIINPRQKNVLLGINRFTEQAYYGSGSPISTGEFGEIYGIKVYVTTQTPTVTAANGTTVYDVNILMHKDAFVYASQLEPRVQSDYVLEYLGNLVVVDTIYGVATFRDSHAVALVTPQ